MTRIFMIGAILSLLLASRALATPLYSLTDLGTLGGSTSTGTAINDNGYAVGSSTTSGGATHAFEYSPVTQSMIDLGVVAGQTSSVATGIDNSNSISGNSGPDAFRYTSSLVSLGVGTANGINNGVIIGSIVSGANNRTVEWNVSNTRTTFFPAQNTQGLSLNTSGHMIGLFGTTGGYYANGSTTLGVTQTLGDFIPDTTNANDIFSGKDAATNVAALFNFATHTMTELGKLLPTDASSVATSLNDSDSVVGTSGSAGFIWTSTTGMQSLTSLLAAPGWTIIAASDINNNGQILAEGQFNGVDHAVILSAVPEPSSAVLLGLGVLSLLILASRRIRATARAVRVAAMAIAIPPLAVTMAAAAPLYSLTDLGTLGGSTSTGTAINDNGFAVGSSITSGGATHAFEYSPLTHSMIDLGVVAGQTSVPILSRCDRALPLAGIGTADTEESPC